MKLFFMFFLVKHHLNCLSYFLQLISLSSALTIGLLYPTWALDRVPLNVPLTQERFSFVLQWTSCSFVGCETETKGLSPLGTHTRCAISSSCSDIHCCLHSDILKTNLDAFINIDVCNGKIYIGIEKYQWSHRLLGYKFGEMKHVSLFGMINME